MRVSVRVIAVFLVGKALVLTPGEARAKPGHAGKKAQAQAGSKRAPKGKHVAVQHGGGQHEKAGKPPKSGKAGDAQAVARLGRGTRLFDEADYAAAQKELAPLAQSSLLNRDTALYLLATSEALQIPPLRDQAHGHFTQLAAMQNSRWARISRARAADLSFDLGRLVEARDGYRAALAQPAGEVEPAVARYRLAVIAEKAGDTKGAAELYLRVFDENPSHPLADRALAQLTRLDPKFVPSPTDRIARAQRLTAEHGWQRALDELSLLPKELSQVVRDQADYQIGMTHFKMRHGYDVAAEKLLSVWPRLAASQQSDALFHGARAWSRANEDDRAIAGYKELLVRFPHSKQAPEAAFLIGWLDFNRGKFAAALPGLSACLAKYGSSSFADDAHWYLGFSKWMLGDVSGALSEFEWMAKRSGALDGGKGRYWKGRALLSLGKKGDAIAEWKRLATDYAFSYYALSARVRLLEQGIKTDVFGGTGATVKSRTAPPLPAPDETLAKDGDVARTDELLSAGLGRDAAAELDRVDGQLLSRYGAARMVPLLIDRYERAEDFFHVHRLAEAHAGAALHNDPATDDNARAWWEKVYPLAYRRFVEKYGPTGDNPPYYLYTIMQKESAYNPHDLSYADAIGLLQMIPPTSRRVGERIGRPYTDDVLYDPEGNIQFGAWYIGHLLAKFKGQVALGAGSYNAGPKAMMRWIKQNGSRPLDEFIELCSYTQTREYMKKVLDIYAHYEWLYGKRDYLPDEKIDAKFVENDIDY